VSEQTQTAPDQTPGQAAMTTLLGLVQIQAEQQGWEVEVVSSDENQTILGLTSPGDKIDYSLSMNVTP
jgi:hypothetical protein